MLPVFAIFALKLKTNPVFYLGWQDCTPLAHKVPWSGNTETTFTPSFRCFFFFFFFFREVQRKDVRRETQEGKRLVWFLARHLHLRKVVWLQGWSLKATDSAWAKEAARACLWKLGQQGNHNPHRSVFISQEASNKLLKQKPIWWRKRECVRGQRKNPTKNSNWNLVIES